MAAVGYTIVGLLIAGGVALAVAIVGATYFGVSAARPELLRRDRGDDA